MAMEATDGVKFVIDVVDDATKTMRSIQGHVGTFVRGVQAAFGKLRSIASPFVNVLRTIGTHLRWIGLLAAGAVSAGVYKLSQGILMATTQAETLKARVQTVFGGGWGKAWQWSIGFAKDTPFELNEIIDAMTRLQSYQINPFKNMKTIGDFASAFGRSITDAVEAVADAMMGEWERMKEFGIKRETLQQWMASRGMGNPFNKAGQITSAAGVQQGLFAMMSERGANGMLRMMDTIAGKWSNLKDSTWRFFVNIGDKVAPSLKGMLGSITAMIDKINELGVGSKIGDWLAKTFSRENFLKVVNFFALMAEWGVNAFHWLRDTAHKTVLFLKETFGWLAEYLTGEAGFFGALKKIGRFIVRLQILLMSINIVKAFASIASAVAPVNPYVAGGILAGGIAVGAMANSAGNRMFDDILGTLGNIAKKYGFTAPPALPKIGDMPQSGIGKQIVDAAAAGWNVALGGDKDAKDDNKDITDPLKQIADNTSALVSESEKIIGTIYGGGDRMRMLSNRLAFGLQGPMYSNEPMVFEIKGGSARDQEVAMAAISFVTKRLHIRRSIKPAGF